MTTILGASASGLVHNQKVMDIIGNNLANVNTAGFKKMRPLAEGTPTAGVSPDDSRLGVALTTGDLIFNTGAFQRTDDPLHFAINDDSFFQVRDFDGSIAYTRLGALQADSSGNITAYGGRFLEPPITLPAGYTAPSIDTFGQVTAADGDGQRQVVGQITLVGFENPQGLDTLGDGLYQATPNTGGQAFGTPGDGAFGELNPGSLEGSNVDVAEEFTNMIIAQRAYQASAKTFSIGDEMLALATNITQ